MNHGIDHFTPDTCYGCKIKTLSTSFGSINGVLQGSAGRNAFHGGHRDGGTVRERRNRMIEDARKKGVEPVEMTRKERSQYKSGERIG